MVMPSSLSLACAFLTRSLCLPAHSASSLPSNTYFMGTSRSGGTPRESLRAALHAPPRHARGEPVEPAMRLQAHGLEDHGNAALHMMPAIERVSAARIGPRIAPPVIGRGILVGGVIGVSEFVILGFGDAPERDEKAAPEAQALGLEIAPQM